MTETTFLLEHIRLPDQFLTLCQQYSIVTLLQALELIQRLLEAPSRLPEGITLELLNSVRAQITAALPPELLEQLRQPPTVFPLDGLILDPPPESDCSGELSLEELLKESGKTDNGAPTDEHTTGTEE